MSDEKRKPRCPVCADNAVFGVQPENWALICTGMCKHRDRRPMPFPRPTEGPHR